MNIFNNKLVKKYFECDENDCQRTHDRLLSKEDYMSYQILQAMQVPIRKEERFIVWNGVAEPYEAIAAFDIPAPHQINIRLPDKFQKKGCSISEQWLIAKDCKCGCRKLDQPQRDKVEEKINEIYKYHHDGHIVTETASLDQRLRELVQLVKENK